MKKKKLMKKVIIWVLVLGIIGGLVAFLATRGDDIEEIVIEDVSVFSVYLPTGDTTTEEDILNVERDINNTLLVECNCAVKLYMAPIDRYETMLESAKEMMVAFNENNSKSVAEKKGFEYKFDYKTSTFSWKCDDTAVTPQVVYNSDTVIDILDSGKEIYPNNPSIDIAVFTNYEDYYQAYKNNELVRLDILLENEIKELKQSISGTLFSAIATEKDGKGIYGIPTVRPIGEYEYMIFDKDLLEKYGRDKNQMTSIEDLESYLKVVAEGENGAVVPLLNTPSTTFYEMYNGKHSIAVADNGAMLFPYADTAFQNYYVTLSRYRTFGYIGDEDANFENTDFAVAFFRGTKAEIEAFIKESGKNYVYNGSGDGSKPFAKPIATDTEVGEAIYCVFGAPYSSYAADAASASDDQKKAADFIRILNKKSAKESGDVKNILLYGAPGIHYTISDTDGTVVLLKDNKGQHTYSMYNLYTGNTFHAYSCTEGDYYFTDEIREEGIKHNLDLILSKFTGFVLEDQEYLIKDKNGENIIIPGIDIFGIIDEVCDKYYKDFINGNCGAIDLDEFNASASIAIRDSVMDALADERLAAYEQSLNEQFKALILADETKMAEIRQRAETNSVETIFNQAKKDLEAELRNKYAPYGYDEETIQQKLETDLSDEAVNKYIEENYDDEKREAVINNLIYGDPEAGSLGYIDADASNERKLYVSEIEAQAKIVARQILNAMKAIGTVEDEKAMLSDIEDAVMTGDNAFLGGYANIVDLAVKLGYYDNSIALVIDRGSEEFAAIVDERIEKTEAEQYTKLLDKEISSRLSATGSAIVKEINMAFGEAYKQYLEDNAEYADQIMTKVSTVDVKGMTGEGGVYEGIFTDANGKAILLVSFDGKATEGTIMKAILQQSYYDLKGEPK